MSSKRQRRQQPKTEHSDALAAAAFLLMLGGALNASQQQQADDADREGADLAARLVLADGDHTEILRHLGDAHERISDPTVFISALIRALQILAGMHIPTLTGVLDEYEIDPDADEQPETTHQALLSEARDVLAVGGAS